MRSAWAWVCANKARIIIFIAWATLFWFQGTGLNLLGGVNEKVVLLQGENAALREAVAALKRVVEEQDAKIVFLMDCLTKPFPWPGSTLCPKPSQ